MNGADIHTVALVLGHKDLRMAARYQHLSPAFLSDAVKLLDSAFADGSQEPKKDIDSRFIVTTGLPAGKGEARGSVQVLCFVWRPRRDSNPCYRRERAFFGCLA